jgi:hypothetical protein
LVAAAAMRMSIQLVWLQTSRLWGRIGAPVTRMRVPISQATAPRNHGGTGERRSTSLQRRWTGAATANSRMTAAMRPIARAFTRAPAGLTIAVFGDAVKLHAMIDEAEAELLGDALLKRLQLVVDELDDVAGLDVDQMVVVRLGGGLVT